MASTTDNSNLIGRKGEAKAIVEKHLLASQMKSGDVEVYGSPAMIGLMEEASVNAIKELLPSGQTSVGVGFNIQHLSATPLGLNVRAEAVVTEVNGRKVKLSVTAFDDKEKIGEGTHERVLVDHARFIQKANAKLDSKAN